MHHTSDNWQSSALAGKQVAHCRRRERRCRWNGVVVHLLLLCLRSGMRHLRRSGSAVGLSPGIGRRRWLRLRIPLVLWGQPPHRAGPRRRLCRIRWQRPPHRPGSCPTLLKRFAAPTCILTSPSRARAAWRKQPEHDSLRHAGFLLLSFWFASPSCPAASHSLLSVEFRFKSHDLCTARAHSLADSRTPSTMRRQSRRTRFGREDQLELFERVRITSQFQNARLQCFASCGGSVPVFSIMCIDSCSASEAIRSRCSGRGTRKNFGIDSCSASEAVRSRCRGRGAGKDMVVGRCCCAGDTL